MSTTTDQRTATITVYGSSYTPQAAQKRVGELTAQNLAWGESDDRCTQLALFAEQGITPQATKPAKPGPRHYQRDLYQAPDRSGKTHYVGIVSEFACGTDARAIRTQCAIRVGTGYATCQRCRAIADREDREVFQ